MTQVKWYNSIQFKLQFAICMIFIFCIGGILTNNYLTNKKQLEKSLAAEMENRYSQVIEHIDNASLRALSLAVWTAHSDNIIAIFDQKDREKLEALTLPIYQKIKKEININQFQFHLPPATSFLRLHKPGKYGDDLSKARPTIVAVNTEKKNVMGLDRGPFGFGIRGLSPIFYRQKHIGSVEFAISLNDTFLKRLKDIYNSKVAIVSKNKEGKFNILAKNFEFSNSDTLFNVYEQVMDRGNVASATETVEHRHIYSFVGPLKDFNGKIEGVVVVEKDISAHIDSLRRMLVVYCAMALATLIAIVLVLYFIFKQLLHNRISQFSKVLRKASEGDLTVRSQVVQADEMGMLGHMLNVFLDTNQNIIRNLKKDTKILRETSGGLHLISDQMTEQAKTLSLNTEDLEHASKETNDNVDSIAAAIEETATNVEQISKKVAVLSQSLQSISRETSSASEISSHATQNATDISNQMTRFETMVKDINKITETINDISEQTNLLALNATIEAARAGEAGKGFAVVATEIKSLANQTGEATSDIRTKIENIQLSTNESVEGIIRIVSVIREMDDIVHKISENVDEQSTNTMEIAQNSDQAALGIKEVAQSAGIITSQTRKTAEAIAALNKATTHIEESSYKINENSGKMDAIAMKFKEVVKKFIME